MKHKSSSHFARAVILTALFCTSSFTQWTQQVSNTDFNLYSSYFTNNSTGFLCSSSPLLGLQNEFRGGEIIRTTNGGLNWSRVLLDSAFRGKGFYFIDQNTGYAVGGYYTALGRVLKTTNAGVNWFNPGGDSTNAYIYNIIFINEQLGFAGTFNGVLKTTDGCASWTEILDVVNQNFTWGKTYFTDANTGFFTINFGDVYKTTNAGLNWAMTTLPGNDYIYDIKFINSSTGYITCDSGSAFKTTNAGDTWVQLNTGVQQSLFSISFPSVNTGYISAQNTVIKTTNAGTSWFTVFNFPADTLFSSFFLTEELGFTCGDEGRVYKTTTGGVIGIIPVSTEIPQNFSLEQNYPNPFNPTTNIKFALPKAAFVKLAVYDMLGREVEQLVNQQLTPGTYQVDWNAIKFSSGIYLYRLTTNDFSMVKKMSLIK